MPRSASREPNSDKVKDLVKTVPLEVSIEGEDSEDIKRTVNVPEKITLKGKASDL